jgi:protein SCO1
MHAKTFVIVGFVLGLILAVFIGSSVLSGMHQFNGSLIEPPIEAADFILIDQNGEPYRLSEQRGKLVVIFFGYTHCPDICPSTLSEFQKIQKDLKSSASEVDFVFITVDPERDTPDQLASYLEFFDPSFIGLWGESGEMQKVWSDYGVYQMKQDAGSAAGYLVDHSTRMYVIDQKGLLVLTYPFGFDAEKIVDDIAYLVKVGNQ